MIGSFTYNNQTSESFGLVSKSVKRPLLPSKKVNRVERLGASGVYDFDDGDYSLRKVSMKIAYIESSYTNLRSKARQLAAWLAADNDWHKLIINDEPDKYYLAKITSEINLDSLYESGSADIEFDCQPFAYSVDELFGYMEFVDYTGVVLTHPGTRSINYKSPPGSKFKIAVSGSWDDLSISMNYKGFTIPLSSNNGPIEIDNIEMTIVQGGQNIFSSITGDIDTFMTILPGENTLYVSGTNANATVIVEYIPLWY